MGFLGPGSLLLFQQTSREGGALDESKVLIIINKDELYQLVVGVKPLLIVFSVLVQGSMN
jgi:hypothetical protein